MIALANVSKRYGRQILFVETSLQVNAGEKIGLVGPNGAGKTTLLRMLVGEEAPDEGTVSVPRTLTIGYFRQDIGDMSGRTVLDEAIAGSGRLGDLHHAHPACGRDGRGRVRTPIRHDGNVEFTGRCVGKNCVKTSAYDARLVVGCDDNARHGELPRPG